MRTAEEAIAAVAQWDGTAEYPPGSNDNWLTQWYGMGPVAWCAITMSRTLIEAGFGTADRINVPGVNTTSAKGWAYVPYVENDFRAAGRWSSSPLPGDLVVFDWDSDGWGDHVGMVASVDPDGSVYSWEGNTDEGVIRLKHRSRTYTRGFARPPYLAVPPSPSIKELPMRFTFIAEGEDYVYLTDEEFCGRLPFGDFLDQIKQRKAVENWGEQSSEFLSGVVALADQCGFRGDRG